MTMSVVLIFSIPVTPSPNPVTKIHQHLWVCLQGAALSAHTVMYQPLHPALQQAEQHSPGVLRLPTEGGDYLIRTKQAP